jgi:hypothetical protein
MADVFGTCRYFIIVEVLVFVLYMVTLPLLLFKSRFINIGVD